LRFYGRAHFALSLPDSVFENGGINHEAIQLIHHERREEDRMRQKQLEENYTKKKYDTEIEQLHKRFRELFLC
jgi:hypothetical protein